MLVFHERNSDLESHTFFVFVFAVGAVVLLGLKVIFYVVVCGR